MVWLLAVYVSKPILNAGESLLHVLIICDSPIHTRLYKYKYCINFSISFLHNDKIRQKNTIDIDQFS